MNLEDKWFVIVNPTAGHNRAEKRWPSISKMLKDADIPHDFEFTRRRGHGALLARNSIRKGYRKIISVGGDGTNNEVVNGIMKQKVVPSSEIKYCVIAVGTGNDWIKTHKIPKNTRKVIDVIKRGKTTLQDIGIVNYITKGNHGRRFFANVAGMSYDAYVVKASNERRNFVTNQLFYLYLVFECLFRFKTTLAKVIFDDQQITGSFFTINIGVCKYSGGGMQFVPHANYDDGKFALTFAKDATKMDLIMNTHRLYKGTIGDHHKIHTHHAKSIRVESAEAAPTLLEVDGEYVGETPVEFSLVEKALRVVIP